MTDQTTEPLAITLYDPLADLLGAGDGRFTYTFDDAVKLAGHACPTVAGAFLMAVHALRALYGAETPRRGEVRVRCPTRADQGVTGPISQVFTLLTGAAAANGFQGLGGRFIRQGLLEFDAGPAGPFSFQRLDTGVTVEVSYEPSPFPPDPAMMSLLQRISQSEPDAGAREGFRSLWRDRVERILADRGRRTVRLRLIDPDGSLRVHVLQHAPFEDIGCIAEWLAAKGIVPSYTRLYADESLPDPAGIGLLIVLGGPMSVHDEALHPWLIQEKAFILEAIRRETPMLGICLGAQLIAEVLGGRVHPNPEPEIGWWSIEGVEAGGEAFRFPAVCRVFHWHGETFTLPPGAALLARSPGCDHQAFQARGRMIGLQFHLETTEESVAALLTHCPDDLRPGWFVQGAEAIRDEPEATRAEANGLMGRLLDYLTTPAPWRG